MRFDIITIFPDIFDSYFSESILKRAQKNKLIDIKIHNLRDHAEGKHKKVDDTPYGGGPGMVMQVGPIYKCVEGIRSEMIKSRTKAKKNRIILFSAKGKRYTQAMARRLAKYDNLILICGRYEGVDERVAQHLADEEISIGEYVLTGGEVPAMVVIDSVARLLPGVLGNMESANDESHSKKGYLEYPQYTKPDQYRDWKVPEILMSGNHQEIKRWRKEHSVKK